MSSKKWIKAYVVDGKKIFTVKNEPGQQLTFFSRTQRSSSHQVGRMLSCISNDSYNQY